MRSDIRFVNAAAAAKERADSGLPPKSHEDVLRSIIVLAHRALIALNVYEHDEDAGQPLRLYAILNDIADTAAEDLVGKT